MANISQSRVKQFRRCQKQYSFRYDYAKLYGEKPSLEMVPLRKKLPLYRGTWMHALQEALHHEWAGVPYDAVIGEGKSAVKIEDVENWREVHEALTKAFEAMFDEEREDLGDLPTECHNLFRDYLAFWKEDRERYKVATLPNGKPAIEFLIQADLAPFGMPKHKFKGRLDLMVEDVEYGGLWIWDAKWVKTIPVPDERMMSPQNPLYVWGVRKTYDLNVRGFVYNYGRTKPPAEPQILKKGVLSTKKNMDTTYATYLRAIKAHHGETWKGYVPYYMPKLRELQGREALWYRRERIPVEDSKILAAVREYVVTVRDIDEREKRREYVPRSYFYNCKFSCDYHNICCAEFAGLEIEPLIKANYQFVGERYGKEEDLLDA